MTCTTTVFAQYDAQCRSFQYSSDAERRAVAIFHETVANFIKNNVNGEGTSMLNYLKSKQNYWALDSEPLTGFLDRSIRLNPSGSFNNLKTRAITWQASQTQAPTKQPTQQPTEMPTLVPTLAPTTKQPTLAPTSKQPTLNPTTKGPTESPTTSSPTPPTQNPTLAPTLEPTPPTLRPTQNPTNLPNGLPNQQQLPSNDNGFVSGIAGAGVLATVIGAIYFGKRFLQNKRGGAANLPIQIELQNEHAQNYVDEEAQGPVVFINLPMEAVVGIGDEEQGPGQINNWDEDQAPRGPSASIANANGFQLGGVAESKGQIQGR